MKLKKISILLFCTISLLKGMAQSVGGNTTGAALYCDSVNSGFISLSGYVGHVLYWEISENQGQNWLNIGNSTPTQSYHHLQHTTSYRAIVQDASSPQDTSSVSTITVYVPGNAGSLSGGGTYCSTSGNGTLAITNAAGNILYWQYSTSNGEVWNNINNTSASLSYTPITHNMLYRAVVQTVAGCPNDTTAFVSFSIVAQTEAGTILNSDSLCYGAHGDTLHLSQHTGNVIDWLSSSNNGLSWTSLGVTDTFLPYEKVTQTIWYKVMVKNGICPTQTTLPGIMAVYNVTPAEAGNDATITRFDKITLNGKGHGTPSWSDAGSLNDAASFDPVAMPLNTTTYILTLTDTHGCITADSVTIRVIVPAPTAITPNKDGVNDLFEIDKIEQYPNSSLKVFNRWGLLVYQAAPYLNQWDGKNEHGHDLPDETYYYVFDYGNGEKAITNYILIKR